MHQFNRVKTGDDLSWVHPQQPIGSKRHRTHRQTEMDSYIISNNRRNALVIEILLFLSYDWGIIHFGTHCEEKIKISVFVKLWNWIGKVLVTVDMMEYSNINRVRRKWYRNSETDILSTQLNFNKAAEGEIEVEETDVNTTGDPQVIKFKEVSSDGH